MILSKKWKSLRKTLWEVFGRVARIFVGNSIYTPLLIILGGKCLKKHNILQGFTISFPQSMYGIMCGFPLFPHSLLILLLIK